MSASRQCPGPSQTAGSSLGHLSSSPCKGLSFRVPHHPQYGNLSVTDDVTISSALCLHTGNFLLPKLTLLPSARGLTPLPFCGFQARFLNTHAHTLTHTSHICSVFYGFELTNGIILLTSLTFRFFDIAVIQVDASSP